MKKYVFSSIDAQIEILKSRGMIIEDRIFARDYLMFGNYYNVVNAFKRYILCANSEAEKYKEGLRFENLADLCDFESSLRNLFFKYLLKAELGLKTHLAYELAKAYGPFGYSCLSTYNSSRPKNVEYARELIIDLEDLIAKNVAKSGIVNHFLVEKKTKVPLWALVCLLDFGMLRRLYQNINPNVSNLIAKNYYSLSTKALQTMISSLNVWRNICAHGNRLLCFQMKDYKKQVCDTPLHAYLGIEKDELDYRKGKRDLFSIVICLKYLLKREDFSDFIHALNKEIASFSKKIVSSPIDFSNILAETGIPSPADPKGGRLWTKIEDVDVSDLAR